MRSRFNAHSQSQAWQERRIQLEVRYVYVEAENAPVCGNAIYIVVETLTREVVLFYPWTLTEFRLARQEYRHGEGKQLWPENETNLKFCVQSLVHRIKIIIQDFAARDKAIPTRTVMRVLRELDDMAPEDVEEFIKAARPVGAKSSVQQVKMARQFRVSEGADITKFKGRPRVVLDILVELKVASIPLIVEKASDVLKSKLDHERVVTYFVNKFVKDGILEELGQQLTL